MSVSNVVAAAILSDLRRRIALVTAHVGNNGLRLRATPAATLGGDGEECLFWKSMMFRRLFCRQTGKNVARQVCINANSTAADPEKRRILRSIARADEVGEEVSTRQCLYVWRRRAARRISIYQTLRYFNVTIAATFLRRGASRYENRGWFDEADLPLNFLPRRLLYDADKIVVRSVMGS